MKAPFKLVSNPTFRHLVPIMAPVDGGSEEQTLGVTYRVLDTSELARMETEMSAPDLAMALVESIDGVVDGDGQTVAMNDRVKTSVLKLPFVTLAVLQHYRQAMAGAAAKN